MTSRSERLDRASKLVLIADDSDTYRAIAARVLSDAGYRVEAVSDGAAALAAVQAPDAAIDLLVFELGLPKVRGLDLLRRIRERSDRGGVRTLAVGEVFSDHLRAMLRELRLDACLNKNHALRELLYLADSLVFPAAAEQRRSQRRLRHLPVNYWVGEDLCLESCFDLSEVGMFVAVADAPPPAIGTHLMLRFWLPNSERLIACEGDVVWLNSAAGDLKISHPPGMGVDFVGLPSEDLDLIRAYLDSGS